MRMDVEDRGDWTVLRLSGELTQAVDDEFTQRVVGLIDAGQRRVVLDAGELAFVSSAGLAALVRVAAHCNSHSGRLLIANPSLFVGEVLRTTRLDKFFELFPTVAAALAAG